MRYIIPFTLMSGYIIYRYRFSIILNANYYYRYVMNKFLKYRRNNSIKIIETDTIYNYYDKQTKIKMYIYQLGEFKFISFIEPSSEFDIEVYNKFKETNQFNISTPNDIIMANLSFTHNDKENEIDVIEDVKMLTGPYIDQITNNNKENIASFLSKNITGKLTSLEIMMSNGDELKINF